MAMAITLKSYLDQQGIDYQMLPHRVTATSTATAEAAHVPGDQLAKAVIVKDGEHYLMVVLPADHRLHLGLLHRLLGHEVGLATEQEIRRLFPDCTKGAIPPVGAAYAMQTLVDNSLMPHDEVFFESGDHEHLVKVSPSQFSTLIGQSQRVDVSLHM
jgi:Ala-tRNA(Pro) deacylase